MFLRKTTIGREPLPLTMSGVRMGERVLQIGIADPSLAGAIAAKVGVSGHAAIAVQDEREAERARAAAADAGALADVQVTPFGTLPFDTGAFDVIVIDGRRDLLGSLDDATRTAGLRECLRVLRPGGRLVAVEAGPRSGLAGLLRSSPKPNAEYASGGGTVTALERAGFRAARPLGERDGFRFAEGLKG